MVTLIGSNATIEELLARLLQIAKQIEIIEARQDFLAHQADEGDLTISQRRQLIEAGGEGSANYQNVELADFALLVDRDELTELLDQEDFLLDELVKLAADRFPDSRDLFYEAAHNSVPATRTVARFLEKLGQ